MSEELDNKIVLTDEQGRDADFEFLDLVEYAGADYVVLLPLPDDGSGEVVILKVEQVPGSPEEEAYNAVEDDGELEAVFQVFLERYNEED